MAVQRLALALLAGLAGTAGAQATQATCTAPNRWDCQYGCYDVNSTNCSATMTNQSSCTAIGHEWRQSCNCLCLQYVCDFGCWDTEDEGCLADTNQMQCAEIYGHVEWQARCNCRLVGRGESAVQNNLSGGEASIYFSVPAFIVLFRESLEVVIVLVIIMQFLTKAKNDGMINEQNFRRFRREVYIGASMGFLICMIIGVGFLALASLFRGLFKGNNLRIFDFVMMILTSLVLSFLALNFYKMIHAKEGHERKMKECIERTMAAAKEGETDGSAAFGKKHSFLILAFTTGLREGLESIIFLVGVVSDVDDLSSLPLPIISALVLARICGCIFFQSTKKMRVEWFLRASAIILMTIAAGFFSQSMHKIQELGAFGTWSPKEERPWQNQRVWDARECCNDKTNRFFVLMRALFGWQDQPTPTEFFAYALYWIVAIALGVFFVRRAKRAMEARLESWKKADAEEREKQVEGGLAPEGEKEATAGEAEGGLAPEGEKEATAGEVPQESREAL